MKNFSIHLQYGEHTFRRVTKSHTLRAALLDTMVFIKQEFYMRDLAHINVARPNKLIVKVGI